MPTAPSHPTSPHPRGTQILVDLYDCDALVLADECAIRDAMLETARRCGATVVSESFHRFSPHGVSGVVVIAESHITIHTWPEHRYAAVDLFTCGDTLRADDGLAFLTHALVSTRQSVRTLTRGDKT